MGGEASRGEGSRSIWCADKAGMQPQQRVQAVEGGVQVIPLRRRVGAQGFSIVRSAGEPSDKRCQKLSYVHHCTDGHAQTRTLLELNIHTQTCTQPTTLTHCRTRAAVVAAAAAVAVCIAWKSLPPARLTFRGASDRMVLTSRAPCSGGLLRGTISAQIYTYTYSARAQRHMTS